MGFTEQFDVLLLTRKRGRVVRLFLAALLALLVLDVVGTLLLRLAPSIIIRSKSPPAWSWAQLGDFRDDTLDLFLLLILRTLLVATLGVAAVRCGTPNLTAAPAEVDGLAPLLLNGSGGGSVCEVVPPESGGNGAAQPTHAVKAEHLRSHALKEAAEVRKGLLVAAIFGVSTAAQVYVGVKCISFRGEWERDAHVLTAQGVLFGVAVLLINVESWLLKRLAGGKRVSSLRDWTIEISEVAFRYQMRPGNPVLEGVSFSVPAGSVCALVGRSGGGKSTLVHLLLRYYDPLSGAIRLGGADYRDLDLPSLHAATGVVSQDSQLFDSLACQRQRLAIARCLLRKPRLLLLDEATSALDAESESLVQRALDDLIWGNADGGKTVVLVAHRLSTVVNAAQIVVLDRGAVAEVGPHAALLERDGIYASLVAKQLHAQAAVIDG
ncbi:putative ABC transporter [Emiliania huxleyi CCMP1516]|uniref:ABC transporter domain-containing protein n=2 Tax=Emiliania huxleyi TaxID=2903 RepID=A0A0D3KXS1_EMIH1|nr:putative ABC transporter [Emiliania huxleyi CCMP1516]EOD40556.1 putative ABC transporter [Emiliania huxleyi CCMP1516]|eukprot:XP_005792985.1 putative ABC transporter [Emiliania huxleyi CCMP1516]